MSNSAKPSTSVLSVRLSADERGLLLVRAGNKSMSAYVRAFLFEKEAISYSRKGQTPKLDRAELAKLLAWLGESQIAAHLAILANAAESGSLDMSEPVTKAVFKACADIDHIRTILMQAMGKRNLSDDVGSDEQTIIPAFLNAARNAEGLS